MDLSVISLISSSSMLSAFLIPALTATLSHLQFSDRLERDARITIQMNEDNMNRSINSAEYSMQSFLYLVKINHGIMPTGKGTERLTNKLQKDIVEATAQFAVFEQIHNKDPEKVGSKKADIHFLLVALQQFYVNHFGMNAQQAEGRIKEDVFFALTALDMQGDIGCSDMLNNPATAFFQLQNLPKKTS